MRALLAIAILLLTASTAHAADVAPTALPAPPASESEPNDTAATATAIQPGGRVRASIMPADDVELYRFQARAGDRVYAATMTSASSGRRDTELRLLGSDGATEIESDDNDGHLTGSSSIAGATVPTHGTYYLEVTGPIGAVPTYELWLDVRSGTPVQESEPNSSPEEATPTGDAVFAGTNTGSERDDYALRLGAGDTVFLSLDMDPARDDNPHTGGVGFGTAETVIVTSPKGSNDAAPSAAFFGTAPTAGTYLAFVSGDIGAYRLSITIVKSLRRSCHTYTITPANGSIPDRSEATFAIDAPDAATIDHVALGLDLTHPLMSHLDVTLQAPGGYEIPVFTNIGSVTAGNAYTRMRTLWDDDAAMPSLAEFLNQTAYQPEASRLGFFSGRPAAGTWTLRIDDDRAPEAGSLARVDLILCARPPDERLTENVFSAGFEHGADGFTHSGTADSWERGTPSTPAIGDDAGLAACAGGTRCFKTDLDASYQANSSQDLVSPPISLAGRTGAIFASWAMWYQLQGAYFDHASVSVEEDGGTNRRPLFTWTGDWMDTLIGSSPRRLAWGAGWDVRHADISDYAGKTIRLRFHLDSDKNFDYSGLAIDDVRVYQVLFPLDVEVTGPGRVTSEPAGIDCDGTCSINRYGEVTLTPHPDAGSRFAGFDGCSGTGLTCTVTVDQARHVSATFTKAPVGSDDAYATDEDVALRVTAPGVLGNDSDADGDKLTASLVSEPEHGRVELAGDGSFVYTPDKDYNGEDSFTYRASDGALESAETAVALDVAAVEDLVPVEATPSPTPTAEPPATPAPVIAASPAEPALSQLRLASGCVRRDASGRARVVLNLRLAQPGRVQVHVERAVSSTARSRCWTPRENRTAPALSWRSVTTMRSSPQAVAAAVHGRMRLSLRLKPGLYRLSVQAVLDGGKLSSPVQRFVRVR